MEGAFPTALALGMTPGQYWDGPVLLFCAYREARRIEDEREEWRAWQAGAYVYEAVARTSPLVNALSSTHRAEPWLEEPFGVAARRTPEEAARAGEGRAHARMIDWMLSHRPTG